MVPAYYATVTRAPQPMSEPASKIGGRPVFVEEIEWPACAWCGRTMQFWWQVRLDEPIRFSDTYVMAYVFACPGEQNQFLEPRCPAWDQPYEDRDRIGMVLLQRGLAASHVPDGPTAFPDYALSLEHREEPDRELILFLDTCTVPGAKVDPASLEAVFGCWSTKIGGNPCWHHTNRWPVCPVCQGITRFVFQVQSILNKEDCIDVDGSNFGDGYVFIGREGCSSRGAVLVWQHGP